MVDKVNVQKLLDALRAVEPSRFKMGVWHCGTAACLGGLAQAIMGGPDIPHTRFMSMRDRVVSEWLGLSKREGESLYYMMDSQITTPRFDSMSPEVRKQAGIKVLELLLETGKMDWDSAVDYAVEMHEGERHG